MYRCTIILLRFDCRVFMNIVGTLAGQEPNDLLFSDEYYDGQCINNWHNHRALLTWCVDRVDEMKAYIKYQINLWCLLYFIYLSYSFWFLRMMRYFRSLYQAMKSKSNYIKKYSIPSIYHVHNHRRLSSSTSRELCKALFCEKEGCELNGAPSLEGLHSYYWFLLLWLKG